MQICEGVAFMHSCNIIHLDMKVCKFHPNQKIYKLNFLAGEYFMFKSKWSSNKNN